MTKVAATCPNCEKMVVLDYDKGVMCKCGRGPFVLAKTEKGITVYCVK